MPVSVEDDEEEADVPASDATGRGGGYVISGTRIHGVPHSAATPKLAATSVASWPDAMPGPGISPLAW